MKPSMVKRKRRKFAPEFKADTVRLVRQSGKTIAEIARDLDHLGTVLALDALDMALGTRATSGALIHHADRVRSTPAATTGRCSSTTASFAA